MVNNVKCTMFRVGILNIYTYFKDMKLCKHNLYSVQFSSETAILIGSKFNFPNTQKILEHIQVY